MKIDVLGIPFDAVTMKQAVQKAIELIESKTAHYVVTPNAEIVHACLKNEALAKAVKSASLIIPDGAGVVLGSEKLGRPLPEKVAGVDLIQNLLPYIEKSGKKLFLLGGKPGVPEIAEKNILKKFPNMIICGTRNGYDIDDAIVTKQICDSGADVVIVCLGAPKQELWMVKNKKNVGHALMLGLGGAIDIFAGTAKRAPKFFINLRLEWFYRLLMNPSRYKRMMDLPRFMGEIKKQAKQEAQK